MKILIEILLTIVIIVSCNTLHRENNISVKKSYEVISNNIYELHKPQRDANAVLILFGGFSENAEAIKREFTIIDNAKKKNIAVLYMNINRKLWLNESERVEVSDLLINIFKENKLPTDNIFVGGFSSGGNICLLLANYLSKENKEIKPQGLFVVDSPVDLLALYQVYQRNIKRNFSEASVNEANWLIELFNKELGNPKEGIEKYKQNSPFISKLNYLENVSNLNEMKIRFYTEPDTVWWKKNRQNDYQDLNAYSIEQLSIKIRDVNTDIELIKTENKGYRANGDRHPHSWSIVDKEKLIKWMLDK